MEYSALQRQNTRLNHLLEIIALSQIIDNTPLRRRLEILAKLHEQFEQYNVHELCEALHVGAHSITTSSPGGSDGVLSGAAGAHAAGAADL